MNLKLKIKRGSLHSIIFPVLSFLLLLVFSVTAEIPSLIEGLKDTDGKYSGAEAELPVLMLPVGARGAALGDAGVILGQDGASAFWNPSLLGLLRKDEFSFSHSEMPLGVRNEYISAAFPESYLGTFTVYGQMFSGGSFSDSRDINEEITNPDVFEFCTGASYGGAFIADRLYGGVGVKAFQSRLEDENANGAAGDFSLLAMPGKGFRITAGAKNIGPAVQYVATKEYIPAGAYFGLGQELLKENALRWGVSVSKYLGSVLHAGIGAEYSFDDRFAVRAGYSSAIDSARFNGMQGFTLGIGFKEQHYSFDYAWEAGTPELGSTHYFTLTASFKNILPKSAEDYYGEALAHFKRGKYDKCIEEAENALKVNPNLWKAHSLISRSYEIMRRFSGAEIAIVYTGNTKGTIAPEKIGNGSIGGMARRATVVKQLAQQNPFHLVIDAGNLFDEQAEEIKLQAVNEAMENMGYDILGTGISEIKNGLEILCYISEKLKLKHVMSNLQNKKDLSCFVEDETVAVGGKYQIYVANVVGDKYGTKADSGGVKLVNAAAALKERLNGKSAQNANLRIVLVNDDEIFAQQIAALFNNIEIIICSNSNKMFGKPFVIGQTLILSPGENGKAVGMLTVQFNDKKQMLSYQHRLIRLGDEVPEDQQVSDLMEQMLVKAELKKQGKSKDLKRGNLNGTFLFVSDRTGSRNVYIKFMKNKLEYRLTSSKDNCIEPVVNPVTGKVAYIKEWKDTTTQKTYRDLMVMELSGSHWRQVTMREHVKAHVWDPKGKYLYFCSDSGGQYDIYRTDYDGLDRMNISTTSQYNETDVAFSPSGSSVIFVSDRDDKTQLYLTDESFKSPLRLTDYHANYSTPVFSPDGKYLAYLSDKFGFASRKDLVVQNMSTSEIKYLSQNANVRSYVWRTDGSAIIFESGENMTDINTVTIPDGVMTKLLPSSKLKDYSEQEPRIEWFDNDEWVAFQQAEEKRTIIRRVKLDGSDDETIVGENKGNWLK